MPPIRITFVLPSFAGGGAERVMLTLLAGLERTRFSPSLVVVSGTGPLSGSVPEDVPVIDLGKPRLRSALPAMRRVLRRNRPDVVFSTMAHLNVGVLALQPSLPAVTRNVVREANIPLSGLTGAKRALQRLAYRRLYPRAHAIVCPAQRVADGVVGVVPRAANKVSVVRNPVDVLGLRAHAKRLVRHPGEGLRLVAVGRLTYQKGFDRLIDLMPSFPTASHLTIIGDGPDRTELEAQIAHRGVKDQVALAGYVDNPWPHIAGADVFLLPSRWEGLPNVALEALACGTPVISAPEAGGIDEIAAVAPAAVTLADLGDTFVQAIQLAAPKTEPETLSENLLPSEFEMDSVVAQYETLFRGLVS